MNKLRNILFIAVMVLTTSACQLRPLNDYNSSLILKLKLKLHIENYGEAIEPEVMRVQFYNLDGTRVTEDYTSAQGGQISVSPGTYDMVVYNFDTESTLIRGDGTRNQMEAYTNEVPAAVKNAAFTTISKSMQKAKADTKSLDGTTNSGSGKDELEDFEDAFNRMQNSKLIYEPDHLIVARERVTIYNTSGEQTLYSQAESVVETYVIGIRIKNKKNMASATCLLTGQVPGNYIGKYFPGDTYTGKDIKIAAQITNLSSEDSTRYVIKDSLTAGAKIPDYYHTSAQDSIQTNIYMKEGGKDIYGEPVTLYFTMSGNLNDINNNPEFEDFRKKYGDPNNGYKFDEENDIVWCTFNTFGKYPDADSRVWLSIMIVNSSGETDEWHGDVTDLFSDNPDKYIFLEEGNFPPVVVPDPVTPGGGGGGFQPGVEDWNEEHHDILI